MLVQYSDGMSCEPSEHLYMQHHVRLGLLGLGLGLGLLGLGLGLLRLARATDHIVTSPSEDSTCKMSPRFHHNDPHLWFHQCLQGTAKVMAQFHARMGTRHNTAVDRVGVVCRAGCEVDIRGSDWP